MTADIHRPLFITFEGGEGSGKTSQIQKVVALLKQNGLDCVVTREPGGTDIGSRIRSVLLSPESHVMAPVTELLLYTADRAQHAAQVIRPALQANQMVLCDRFFDATLVYQGHARGMDLDQIAALHRMALNDLQPDLTFLLDLDPQIGLARAWSQVQSGQRTSAETRFESEALKFHQKVRAGYLSLAKAHPFRFQIIDAAQPFDAVTWQIWTILSQAVSGESESETR